MLKYYLFIFLFTCSLCAQSVDDAAKYMELGQDAYNNKDYKTFLDNFKLAQKLMPRHSIILYNLACGYALTGQKDEAIGLLNKIVGMGLVFDFDKDEDFNSIKNLDEFKAVLKKTEKNKAPIHSSENAFTLPEKDLITEGIAYDPAEETFYISSVHQRKIVSRDKNGAVRNFSSDGDGLWCVLGLKVDAKRRVLWACASAFPQMKNYTKEQDGLTGIFKYDLKTKKLIKKYTPAAGKHAFNDIAINSAGELFVSDPGEKSVYRISPGKDELELFIGPGYLASPQGMAFSDDGTKFFIADYSRGIFAVDMKSGGHKLIDCAETVSMLGIDGLCFYKNSFVATQNGINPHRVIRYFLNRDFSAVEKSEILEANNPLFNEPTLCTVVGDVFYFIANSQWGSFNKDGSIFPMEKLQEPLIMKIKL